MANRPNRRALMEFTDDAFVLSARAHGDTGVVVDLLTETHGRRAAYVAGGASRRMKPFLQAGRAGDRRLPRPHLRPPGLGQAGAGGGGAQRPVRRRRWR